MTLFKLKDWEILEYTPYLLDHSYLVAHHTTCPTPSGSSSCVSWFSSNKPECRDCYEHVPDEIQALVKLNNWDKE